MTDQYAITPETKAALIEAVRLSVAGTQTVPLAEQREQFLRAQDAAWKRHDGADVVKLTNDERLMHMTALGFLVTLSGSILQILGQFGEQDPEKLLATIAANLPDTS